MYSLNLLEECTGRWIFRCVIHC